MPKKKAQKKKPEFPFLGVLEKLIDQQQANIRGALDKLKSILEQESSETKEMLEIYARSMNGKASDEDMDRANDQMRDLLRIVGLGFLAVLPLAPMSIPLVVKIGERLGIQVLPSSFQKCE